MEQLLKKLGIEDEVIKKITGAMREQKLFTTKEEGLEEKYTKLKQQQQDIAKQLEGADKTIEELKKDNKDNEGLQSKLKTYEEEMQKLKTEGEEKLKALTMDSAINLALINANVKHSDLLVSKFDKDKLVVGEEGKVIGIEEQLKSLKESYKDLFEPQIAGVAPVGAMNSQELSYNTILQNADSMPVEQLAQQWSELNNKGVK